jgi:D-alanine--(R)-lactate ligase
MDMEKYAPFPIYISRAGEWKLCAPAEVQEALIKGGEGAVTKVQRGAGEGAVTKVQRGGEGVAHGIDPYFHSIEGPTAIISPDKADHGILVAEGGGYRKIRIDAVFPVIHGKMGEDGRLQGLLDISGIPYVGCGLESSVLAMDKSLAHQAARSAGIPTPEFRVIADTVAEALVADSNIGLKVGCEESPAAAAADLPAYPVFVKPARSGSSFGVSKAGNEAELKKAIELARRYDSKTLIEEAISGHEVGCAVLGNGEALLTGEVDMITLSHGFFKIHQEENPEGGSENATVTVPADIPAETGARVKEVAKKVYRALGCRGLARVDMFLREDGGIVLNEVNTMPGFTSYSRYPRMMAAAGIPLGELIDRLISLALDGLDG